MLDLNRPVQTRDGKPVRIIATDIKGDSENKVVGLVDFGEEEILAIRLRNGRLMCDQEYPDDFINVPVRETIFVNIGQSYGTYNGAKGHNSDWPVVKVEVEHDGDLRNITKVLSAGLA